MVVAASTLLASAPVAALPPEVMGHVELHSNMAPVYSADSVNRRILTEGLFGCPGFPGARYSQKCPTVAPAPLVVKDPAFVFEMRPSARELLIDRNLEQDIQSEAMRRSFGVDLTMHYGLEIESDSAFQLRRELVVLAAKVTEMPLVLRAAEGLTPLSTIRPIRESQELDRSSQRATYLQVEEFIGPSPHPGTMAAETAYASAGAGLFISGAVAARFLHGAGLGDSLHIVPQPWPPGLQLYGSFN